MNQVMQVFIGSMFGDGNIFPNEGRHHAYSEIHSLKQKEYLLWKMKIMSKEFNFANSPYIFDTYDKRTKRFYHHIKINCSNKEKLEKYYKTFYKNGRKIIPKLYLYGLNKLGLAIWYQDDGTYHYGSYTCSIATNRFTYKENLLIKHFLKEKYNLNCIVCHKEDGYYLFFKRKDAEKFLNFIKNDIIHSMKYKLGHLEPLNRVKLIKAKETVSKNKKIYYKDNKEKILNYQKQYRKENKEKIYFRAKRYNLKNRNRINEQRKKYYRLNRVRILERNRMYWHKNSKLLNERKRMRKLENG